MDNSLTHREIKIQIHLLYKNKSFSLLYLKMCKILYQKLKEVFALNALEHSRMLKVLVYIKTLVTRNNEYN